MNRIEFLSLLSAVVILHGCGKSEFAGSAGARSAPKQPTSSADPDPNKVFKNDDPTKQPPKFGMLVNDLRCSFCHLQVRGDVVSLSNVNPLWAGSIGWVNGSWTSVGQWNANSCIPGQDNCDATATNKPNVTIAVQKIENDAASKLYPRDPTSKSPSFPMIDWVAAKLSSKQKFEGNKLLTGSIASPIDVSGDMFVDGDLIIKGKYRGAGTIYVSGNVYIPANLTAIQSPFPFSDNPITALQEAEKALVEKKDALAIASAKSIIVGVFEKRDPNDSNTSVFTHVHTGANDRGEALGILNGNNWLVYNWQPKAQFDTLWDTVNPAPEFCKASSPLNKYVSRIDAFLYAVKAIGGRANNSSYAINGGIIADHFHVITGAGSCLPGIHPEHGYAANRSHINYDWRLQSGLGLLTHMGKYFQ